MDWNPDGANGRTECECDNTHEANDTVCQYCWSRGRRKWLDNDLDDAYDVAPTKGGKPINNRMGTLNRVQGMLNRHRNAGRIK